MARKDDRLYARFTLEYPDHPKIAPLSDAAFRAHVEMVLYSRRLRTDGRIAKRIAKRWPEVAIAELLANDDDHPSLVELDNGDYLLHDFLEQQETNADIERKRQVNAANGRRGGLARAKRMSSESPGESPSDSVSEIQADTDTDTDTPTYVGVPRKRGTRIPDAFVVTREMRAWAAEKTPLVNVDRSSEKFVNYWRAKTRDATKLDWVRTWHNWLISDQEKAEQRSTSQLSPDERLLQTLNLPSPGGQKGIAS